MVGFTCASTLPILQVCNVVNSLVFVTLGVVMLLNVHTWFDNLEADVLYGLHLVAQALLFIFIGTTSFVHEVRPSVKWPLRLLGFLGRPTAKGVFFLLMGFYVLGSMGPGRSNKSLGEKMWVQIFFQVAAAFCSLCGLYIIVMVCSTRVHQAGDVESGLSEGGESVVQGTRPQKDAAMASKGALLQGGVTRGHAGDQEQNRSLQGDGQARGDDPLAYIQAQ
mmetsp:Transcript_8226/g.18000  ORF Transcript_8226/g.18000 Transcript_8226/m.18000 type:complete len:221 (+) Transcript_8226:31-693(+)